MKIGYMRVSTKEQNMDIQRDALNAEGCDEIFEDRGISGKEKSRPALDACLARLKPNDTLVIYKLDRLGRNTRHLLTLVEDVFRPNNINLKSITESIDTSTPIGKFFFTICGAFAEMERERIVERVVAGLDAAKARGKVLGQPRKLTGDQVREVIEAYRHGESPKDIAERHGVHFSTIYREVKRVHADL